MYHKLFRISTILIYNMNILFPPLFFSHFFHLVDKRTLYHWNDVLYQILNPTALKSLILYWLLTKKETRDHPIKKITRVWLTGLVSYRYMLPDVGVLWKVLVIDVKINHTTYILRLDSITKSWFNFYKINL